MTRKEANEIVKYYVSQYEGQLPQAPPGKKYQECYDISTNTPCEAYQEMYHAFKKELRDKGLVFKY